MAHHYFSLTKVKEVSAPVLVIHGELDDVVPVAHGRAIFENCQKTVEPLWLPKALHNDIDEWPGIWYRLQHFISIDMVTPPWLQSRSEVTQNSCLDVARRYALFCINGARNDARDSYRMLSLI